MAAGSASAAEGGARAGLVWLDGRLLPRGEAGVSVDDLGFLYGAACFETMRARDGAIFRLDRHFDRLARGLALLGVESPGRAALRSAITATLAANALSEARVRLTVSAGRGSGRPDLVAAAAPTIAFSRPAVVWKKPQIDSAVESIDDFFEPTVHEEDKTR